MLLRTLLKDSFEVVKNYCDISGCKTLFEKQDWYDFFRIVRNCFSHDLLIKYKNKRNLPISWKGRNFTIDMDGMPLTTSFLGINGALELFGDMRKFVEDSL